MTLCRAAVCSHLLVVDRWGHSWESCAPRLSVTLASNFNPLPGPMECLPACSESAAALHTNLTGTPAGWNYSGRLRPTK